MGDYAFAEQIEEQRFAETEQWLNALHESGLTSPPIHTGNECIVIEPLPYVWEWARSAKHAAKPWESGYDKAPLKATDLSGRILHPADFIARLRERNRTHAESLVHIGTISLPQALIALANRIDQSRSIIGLIDPDDDTSVSEETWERAALFVARISTAFWETHRIVPPVPAISDGPDGSIDATWRSGTRQILLNFPGDSSAPITLSGLDTIEDNRRFRDRFRTGDNPLWLLPWLTT